MIGDEIISSKKITLTEVKELMKTRKKEKELTYEQDLTQKYAKNFSKLTEKQAQKLFEELIKLESVDEELAAKLVDVLPAETELIKLAPLKESTVTQEDLTQALELVKKYVK